MDSSLLMQWYSADLVNKILIPNLSTWKSRYDLKEQLLLKDGNLVIRNMRRRDMVPLSNSLDTAHRVTAAENFRPDIVAYNAYGDPRLAWVILAANDLSDMFDFVTGLEIIIPSSISLYQTGGVLNRQEEITINIFGIAGASAEVLLNNLGGFKRLVSNNKFQDNLKVLLETRKGTLIGDPDFGSNLYELLFEPANEVTAAEIRQEVVTVIEKYYNNVVIDSVDIVFKPYSVKLTIFYRIMNTNIEETTMLEFIRGNS